MISLIHPSRGRPQKAKSTYDYWMDNAAFKDNIEHLLSIDINDQYFEEYLMPYVVNNNTCVVEATNIACEYSKGDILIYLSDDFKCPYHWDKLISNEFASITTPLLLKVNDGLQPFEAPVLTIPIMNRQLYERIGYFWHPEYKSMFVDEDLFQTCKKNGWLTYNRNLIFPHEHFINGKAENDETYKRSNAHWEQGKAVFEKRKLEGFPV